ncbi:hypothetical protein ACOMHN_037282 [Nucella lapillus]
MNAIDFYIFWSFFGAVIPPRFQAMWTLFLLHLVSFLWYQPAPCLQQLYPSFFSPALSHPLHYSSPPPPAPVPSVYPLRHYPPPLPSPPSSNLPMRYSRDQLLEIQPSTPNFELVNHLRELRLGVGLPRKRGCRGGRKKLRSIQVVPSRNLHPLMVPPFLQPHPDLQSAVGNAPLSSKHPTHLPTTDCLLSITPLMGGQPSDAPALSPPSPLQQGGQSSNAPALSPPSPLPQGSQPIALALSPSSPLPQDGQPSDAPGLSPSSSTLLLCPSDSTLSICHLNSQSAVKTAFFTNDIIPFLFFITHVIDDSITPPTVIMNMHATHSTIIFLKIFILLIDIIATVNINISFILLDIVITFSVTITNQHITIFVIIVGAIIIINNNIIASITSITITTYIFIVTNTTIILLLLLHILNFSIIVSINNIIITMTNTASR